MERILQNPLDVWKEGAQRIGENLMENLVDVVLANQDKGISQLQELQKWNFVKLVQKVMTTKLFPREPPNVPLCDSPLLSNISLPDASVPSSLGRLTVTLKSVEGLLFQAWRSDGPKLAKSLMWKVVARIGDETLESAHIPMTCGSESSNEAEASYLDWRDEVLSFNAIFDLQADVVIELHRKRMSGDAGEDFIPDTAVTDLQAFFGHRDKSPEEADREMSSKEHTLLESMALKNQVIGVWQLYGRVIIPITSLVNSSSGVVASGRILESEDGKRVCALSGWFHLYPASQQEGEDKYSKPWTGYPGVGMMNPRISLGFFNLKVEYHLRYTLALTLLANIMNPPQKVWVQATKLDLQVFEAAGHRMHHVGHSLPRRVSFFCHPCAIWDGLVVGAFDASELALLATFWILLVYGCLYAPFKALPVVFTLALCVASPKFRGVPSPTLECCTYQPLHKSGPPLPSNVALPESYFAHALGVKSAKVKEVASWMDRHALWAGVPRSGRPEKLVALPKEIKSCAVGSLLLPNLDCPPSSMGTPFGRMDMAVADSTSYAPMYPLFSDDMPHVDLLQLRHMGFMVLEAVQFLVANLSSTFEKITFAYNWTDPTISMISWMVPLILSLELWLVFILLSFLPATLLRFTFLLAPIVAALAMTDPQILKRTGAADALDDFALSLLRWQPESQLSLRVCVNTWDLLYKLGLLTEIERQARLEELCEPTADTSPQTDASPKRSPSSWTWLKAASGGLVPSRSVNEGVGVHHVSAAVLARGKFGGLQRDGRMMTLTRFLFGFLWQPFQWQARLLLFWFIRLPDRREMEHRSIAASQFIGDDLASLFKAEEEEPAPSMKQVRAKLRSSYEHLCRPSVAWRVSSAGASSATTTTKGPPPENPARAFLRRSLTFAAAAGAAPATATEQSAKWYQGARKSIGTALSSLAWQTTEAEATDAPVETADCRSRNSTLSVPVGPITRHRAYSVPRDGPLHLTNQRVRSVSARPKSAEWLRSEENMSMATPSTIKSPSETLDRLLRLEWVKSLARER